jgi:hypothetical protein
MNKCVERRRVIASVNILEGSTKLQHLAKCVSNGCCERRRRIAEQLLEAVLFQLTSGPVMLAT